MGTKKPAPSKSPRLPPDASLADSLFTGTQQRVLGLLFGQPTHYQANPDSPLFGELCGIAQKTVGLAVPLREALWPLVPQIRAAFVYGSVAKRQDRAASDIDLMLISDTLTHSDTYAPLEGATVCLGRAVKPTIRFRKSLAKRMKEGEAFITRVLSQPKVWVIGGEDDLRV